MDEPHLDEITCFGRLTLIHQGQVHWMLDTKGSIATAPNQKSTYQRKLYQRDGRPMLVSRLRDPDCDLNECIHGDFSSSVWNILLSEGLDALVDFPRSLLPTAMAAASSAPMTRIVRLSDCRTTRNRWGLTRRTNFLLNNSSELTF